MKPPLIEKQVLFPAVDGPDAGESIESLLEHRNLRIERILSSPHCASGPYDQDRDEWVVLLQGRALLEIAGEKVNLQAGEALLLPAHTPHRVLDTSPTPPCVWLAVHIEPEGPKRASA